MYIISKCIKKYTKNVVVITGVFVVGLSIMTSIIYVKYKPSYKVTLNGQKIGYVKSKENMQKMIEDYENNVSGNIASNTLPQYELEFISRNVNYNENAILTTVKNNSTVAGGTYTIDLNGNQKIQINKEAEAKGVANTLKTNNAETQTIEEAYSAKKNTEKSVTKKKTTKVASKKKATKTVAKKKTTKVATKKKTTKTVAKKKTTKVATKKKTTKTVAKKKVTKTTNRSSSTRKKETTTSKNKGYAFPVKGCSFSNMMDKSYPSYSGHTGIDVNINVKGKSVVAVKDGTVITSKALKTKSGAYKSYGEYIMIKHSDGKVSLYAHLKAGSRKVKVGDKVKKGQIIGKVGSTGNSSGTHLHFEIRVNGKPVNPLKYL